MGRAARLARVRAIGRQNHVDELEVAVHADHAPFHAHLPETESQSVNLEVWPGAGLMFALAREVPCKQEVGRMAPVQRGAAISTLVRTTGCRDQPGDPDHLRFPLDCLRALRWALRVGLARGSSMGYSLLRGGVHRDGGSVRGPGVAAQRGEVSLGSVVDRLPGQEPVGGIAAVVDVLARHAGVDRAAGHRLPDRVEDGGIIRAQGCHGQPSGPAIVGRARADGIREPRRDQRTQLRVTARNPDHSFDSLGLAQEVKVGRDSYGLIPPTKRAIVQVMR